MQHIIVSLHPWLHLCTLVGSVYLFQMDSRVRDQLPHLPLFAWPDVPASTGGRKKARLRDMHKQECVARVLCNRAILTLQQLFRGHFTDELLKRFPWGTNEDWQRASPYSRSLCENLLLRVKSCLPLEERPHGRAALGRLFGAAATDHCQLFAPHTSQTSLGLL